MKRTLALILSVLFILSACGQAEQPDKDFEKVDVSITELQMNSESNGTQPVDTVISLGKPYTVSAFADETYPDSYNCELTNGTPDAAITSYTDDALAGFSISSLTVVIDLGKVYDSIHTLKASYFTFEGAGISTHVYFNVYTSEDKRHWDRCGSLSTENKQIGALNTAQLTLDKSISARYIRFAVSGNDTWKFIEELSVIANVVPESNINYYNEVNSAYNELGTLTAPTEGGVINRDLEKTSVSYGAKYKYSVNPNPRFADKGVVLTDGVQKGVLSDGNCIGFDGGKAVTVTMDLGKKVTDIADIEVSCIANPSMNAYLPTAIGITAINGSERTPLGITYGVASFKEGNHSFKLSSDKALTAEKLEFTIHTIDNAIHLIEEISVSAYREKSENYLYPTVVIEESATPWDNPTDEYQNLILNQPYQIHVNVDPAKQYHESNSTIDNTVITDGEFSKDHDIHNGSYFKFYLGERRKIVFDLQHISAVDKFTASFCNVNDWAVYAPKSVAVIISPDGKSWHTVGEIAPTGSNVPYVSKGELILDKKVKARYVVFAFDIVHWAGVDELQVFGTQSITDAVDPSENGTAGEIQFVNKRIEPSEELLNGSKDLCLLYHHNGMAGYTVEDLIPYVAYVDKEGNPKDIMFDSALFLYSTGTMPSGGSAHEGSYKSDWEWCVEDLFKPNYNLNALDKAVGQVKEALSLDDDYKYNVTLTLYNPYAHVTDFGDVDGDGVSENMSVYENRVKALNWYIDLLNQRFQAANFQNIQLVGYYWWDEYVDYADPNAEKMLNSVSEKVHSLGKDFFWIPWFTAPGFSDWSQYGFDVACMQPNYVFSTDPSYSNIINCEKYTEMYGMGVEIETWEACLSDKVFYERYMEYIAAGAEYGYMNDTVCMYYQSFFTFRDAANSDNLMARSVYDITYQFIKGQVQHTPNGINDISFTAKKNTPFVGKLELPADKLYEIKITSMPEQGTVTIDNEGYFTFYPAKDFTGSVTFTASYSEYLNWSEPFEIIAIIE